jgi:uncharacterized protein YecT (DUF1311 family)
MKAIYLTKQIESEESCATAFSGFYDTLFIIRLKEAQRAWLKYRDAHIEARFPTAKKGDQYSEYGNIYPQCACMELTELTEERIRILEKWLKGTVEGDVCGGSYKIKQ